MIRQLQFMLSTCLIAGFIFLSGTPSIVASSFNFTDVEAFFDKQIKAQMEELLIPNATISVVADGKVILEKGYGFANLEEQIPVDPARSLFRIGSTSKLFTWTAVMQLVEQGKLDLDADVNTYLDFKIPEQLATAAGNASVAPITLTHLMTHTAGFEDYSDAIFRLSAIDVVPLQHYIHNYLPARVFPPGELMAYSNYGTALAGYIVEQVSGLPFPQYVEQHIYHPLGMNNSTFQQPVPEELSSYTVQAYRSVEGEYQKGDFEFMPDSAGGMSSSAADMAKFMIAILQDGRFNEGRILEEETAQRMRTQLFTHHPSLEGMAYGFIEGMFNGQRTLLHSGSTMLFDSGLYMLPEQKVGMFISYSGGNYLAHKEIFQQFLDTYYPSTKVEANLLPPAGTKERSHKYIGEYHQNRKSFTTSEKFISLTMGMIQIGWDNEGYLMVTHAGDTNRFVEVEPAIYYNLSEERSKDPFGEFRTIVFDKDPLGNIVLLADGPMSYSKAPWYSTSAVTFLALIPALLFIIGSLVYKGIAAGIRLLRRQRWDQPAIAVVARWTANLYSVLTLGFVLGLVISSEFDPVYGLPKVYFGIMPAWSPIVDLIPLAMSIPTVAMVAFTALSWWKGYWGLISRIHYTVFTAAALLLLWIFNYWNLL